MFQAVIHQQNFLSQGMFLTPVYHKGKPILKIRDEFYGICPNSLIYYLMIIITKFMMMAKFKSECFDFSDILIISKSCYPLLQNPSAPGMHNMPDSRDSHMRVSYQDNPGFFQQVQQSFCASLFGILLVIASFPVLYWNEVRKISFL